MSGSASPSPTARILPCQNPPWPRQGDAPCQRDTPGQSSAPTPASPSLASLLTSLQHSQTPWGDQNAVLKLWCPSIKTKPNQTQTLCTLLIIYFMSWMSAIHLFPYSPGNILCRHAVRLFQHCLYFLDVFGVFWTLKKLECIFTLC